MICAVDEVRSQIPYGIVAFPMLERGRGGADDDKQFMGGQGAAH